VSAPALELESVEVRYRRGPAVVRGVSLVVEAGEALALVGPNGSGKTTLLRAVSGAVPLARGRIRVEGRLQRELGRVELARRLAVVPQKAEFAFDYTAEEVVAMGRIPHLGVLGIEGHADRAAIEEALRRTGIEELRDRSVHALSGGELQLVLIARALAQQARILLLDEPTSSLDLGHQHEVLEVLRAQGRTCGLTTVLVTHDLNLASREAGRLVLFRAGAVVAEGRPAEVLTAERIHEVYGAPVAVHATPGRPEVPLIVPGEGGP
jgi:iron complex transport system ATP-binding protein